MFITEQQSTLFHRQYNEQTKYKPTIHLSSMDTKYINLSNVKSQLRIQATVQFDSFPIKQAHTKLFLTNFLMLVMALLYLSHNCFILS